jgi:integrase
MVNGQRLSGTAATIADAEVDRAAAKRRLLTGSEDGLSVASSIPQVASTWTYVETMEQCYEHPSPDGWGGAKSRDHLLMQARDVGKHFGMSTRIGAIDKAAINGYVRSLIALRKSNATINRKLSTLSKLLKFAFKQGGLTVVPDFPTRFEENNIRERELSYEEERQLLHVLRNVLGREDHAQAIECMIDLGVRNSELWAIRYSDVNFADRAVTIKGKGGKGTKNGTIRTLLMSKRVLAIFEQRCASLSANDRVFPHDNAWLRWTWDRAKELMGLSGDDEFIPYVCRHTCASRIARKESNLFKLQYWMGHKTLEMTRRYSHMMPTDMESIRSIVDNEGDAAEMNMGLHVRTQANIEANK